MKHISDLTNTRLEIDAMAHHLAYQFAAAHADRPRKAAQVYRNTLCVCAVYDYLSKQGLEADLESSDSWTALDQSLSDVADLHLTGLGAVECRPVLPQAETLEIAEFWADRLAYIAVQLDHDGAEATQARILGFVTDPQQEKIPLTELRSPQELLKLLAPRETPTPARLSQWLQNVFDAGWEAIDQVLNPSDRSYAYAFRDQSNPIRRAKLLDLGVRLGEVSVALLIGLEPRSDNKVWVRVQLHPVGADTHLPSSLKVTLQSSGGNAIQEESSRTDDFMLQLRGFAVPVGKEFQVQVSYGEGRVTERFIA
jgi:hypothetical protein